MTGLPDGRKSFKIGLAVLIQYQRVTDSHPPSQPSSHIAVASTAFTTSRGKQEAQLMLTNPRDTFRGQSRSSNIVPFHMLGIFLLVQ